MGTIPVRLEKSGRIVNPAAIRRQFNLQAGSEVLPRVEDTGIVLDTRRQALARVRERLRRYAPAGRFLSDELIQERRAESENENLW